MADFVAVLRKTIDGLGETTPETRERVYSKARATIAAKLAALNPPPPPAVAERQKKSLEDAIATVEADYRAAEAQEPDVDDDLETAIAGLGLPQTDSVPEAAAPDEHVEQEAPVQEPEAWSPDDDEMTPAPPPRQRSHRRRSAMPLAAGLAVAVVLAGAGYAAWANRDQIAGLFESAPVAATAPEQPAETAEASAPEPAEAPETESEAEVAAVAPEPEPEPDTQPEADAEEVPTRPLVQTAPAEEEPVVKFTQRLRADGTEVDAGPADGEPVIGEGTSVAAATVAAPDSPAAEQQPVVQNAAAGGGEAETQPLAVAQKAIFYEERTNAEQGSAQDGAIVWSLVQESPGGDLPPEPAIRAEATIPGKDIQLRMTIRRNGDETLPASHIVEMIFLTPENFEGGGIDNVLRIALKDSEQAAGNPLLGIPAKIADGFFLVALTDGAAEIAANTTMLRRQSWIDIPIVYRSGRRALITLEKGVPGDKVFDEALKAWQAARSGAAQASPSDG